MKTEAEPKGGTTNNNNDTIVSKEDHPSHQLVNSIGDTTIHMFSLYLTSTPRKFYQLDDIRLTERRSLAVP